MATSKTIRALLFFGLIAGLHATPAAMAAIAGDCSGDNETDILELQFCINRFIGIPGGDNCTRCDVDAQDGVGITDLQGTINCFLNPLSAFCPMVIEPPSFCGDGVRTGSEQCDDGDTYNTCTGEGCCTGNCTTEETPLVLDLGSEAAMSESLFFYRTAEFNIPFQPLGAIPLRRGAVTGPNGTTGATGLDSYAPGEIPVGWLATDPMVDPMEVPGLACGCLRARELRTCGGEPPFPGSDVVDCTDDAGICPPQQPCRSVYGPGAAASGRIGCSGLTGEDYAVVLDSTLADGNPNKLLFDAQEGPAPDGSAVLNATFSTGILLGTCAANPGNPEYGTDGLPCTDDDPDQGEPFTVPLTTGVASAQVKNVDGMQGTNLTCAAVGVALLCDQLPDTAGFSLVAATVEEDHVGLGDMVACGRFTAR